MELNCVLAPIDFSPVSRATLRCALSLVAGDEASVVVLHTIDATFLDAAAEHGLGERDDIAGRLRTAADERLRAFVGEHADGKVEITTLVGEGIPFLDILQKAEELQVDAIVMGKFGARGFAQEKLLFGTTAERVIRGSKCPVIVLPVV